MPTNRKFIDSRLSPRFALPPFIPRPFLHPVFLALVLLLFGFADARAQVYRFTSYTTNQGLPSNIVWGISQDRRGCLWISTDNGLCRYDGVNYTTYNVRRGLAGNSVRKVVEDKHGRLWITTNGGVSCLDGETLTNYTTAQGLPDNQTYGALCARDGRLWFGTTQGLSRLDGERFVNYGVAQGLPPGAVWNLIEDRAGNLWLAMRGVGLVKFDGKTFRVLGLADGVPNLNVFNVVEDPRGGIWAATAGGPLFLDGRTVRVYTPADGLPVGNAGNIVIDRQGRVWFGTYGGGLARLETNGRFTIFNRGTGLPDNFLTALIEDYEGNIWCGTRSIGAFRFSNEAFAAYTKAQGLGDGKITGIGETPDGTLWFSSVVEGLTALSPDGTVRRYGLKDGMIEDSLWVLHVDSRGRVWTGGARGVSCWDGRRFRNFTVEEIGTYSQITTMCEDARGRMWFGVFTVAAKGVAMYDGSKFTLFSKATHPDLRHDPANQIAADRAGNVWICSEQGLNRFDGERFRFFSANDGLPANRVSCFYEDSRGVMWIGTDAGLCRYDGASFRVYDTSDGLGGNVVRTVAERDGKLWIGTSQGVSVFDGATFRSYTVKDGLVSDDISAAACLVRSNGDMWFGTNAGAVRYRTAPDIARPTAPKLYIAGIRINDSETVVPTDELPPLEYDRNNLTFEFTAASFIDEASVRYKWKLDGFDQDWTPPRADRSVRFTNLPPGTYRFSVKAASVGDLWSEPRTIQLVIHPPVWRTWWFQTLALLGVCAAGYGAYARRINLLKQREEQRIEHLRQLRDQREEQRLEHLRQLQAQKIEHLHQLQEQRAAAMRQLLESVRTINSKLDLAAVLHNIAEEGARLVDGEPGGIGLISGDRILFERIRPGGRWSDEPTIMALGEGTVGRAVTDGQTVVVNDPDSSSESAPPNGLEADYANGWMSVPIVSRAGGVVGVLDIRRPVGREPFAETDVQLVESLAAQSALAIENAALYGELGGKNAELERLYKQEQEAARALQDLNRMKTNFLIVTSHEMRTPLTVLRGYTEALLEQYLGTINREQHRSLSICLRMVDRMTHSFNDILEMLKIHEGRASLNFAVFDITGAVQSVLDQLRPFIEQRRQYVVFDRNGDCPTSADREKIELILINLIQNAVKFTPDEGEIRIRVFSEDESVHIAVEDTGIGIEASELTRIFEKFYTTNDPLTHTSGEFEFSARGTGLGLAIAKSYAEAHGGRIWAESPGPGLGSAFHVLLPCGRGNSGGGE